MDLFGDTADEKEVVQIAGKIMEARSNRSYDIFHIMGQYISEGYMLDLILPLKEVGFLHLFVFLKKFSQFLSLNNNNDSR
jgi:hypothetical protein